MTHSTWQSGDNWEYCVTTTPAGRGGPNFGEGGTQWWVNPTNSSTPISGLYTVSGGQLQLGLMNTPGGDASYINSQSGTTLPFVGCLLNNQNSNLQLHGFWEISVAVANVEGFSFQFDIEDFPSAGFWSSEIDVLIQTYQGVQTVYFLVLGADTNITLYTHLVK